MARRLCIVSGSPLRCDAFVPALTSLRPDDELEIITDRRRGDASGEAKTDPADRPIMERRSRPFLDLALRVDGFAIVPMPAPAPAPAPLPSAASAAVIIPAPLRERVPPPS